MDKRKFNGGHSTAGKAGRPPKRDEQKLIEKLSPMAESAYKALEKAIKSEEPWAIKMFFEYMHGKPVQRTELNDVSENKSMPITYWHDITESKA